MEHNPDFDATVKGVQNATGFIAQYI